MEYLPTFTILSTYTRKTSQKFHKIAIFERGSEGDTCYWQEAQEVRINGWDQWVISPGYYMPSSFSGCKN